MGGMTINNPAGVLTEAQVAVASEVLAQEEAARRHLVIYLSGAHAYGFPSPDSDLDLKAVHVESTRKLLGLASPSASASRLETIRGVEVDYTSNEIGPVLAGALAGNGNYIERFLGELSVYGAPALDELRQLVRGALSRRVYRHYRGFATQQRSAFEGAERPTAKKLLYVLRTALTGAHLLATGDLVTDLARLAELRGLADTGELIARKRAGELAPLDSAVVDRWRPRLDDVFADLDREHERSVLPEAPTNAADVEAWLIAHRLASAAEQG
jgi:predicted nucleotidyltransferase